MEYVKLKKLICSNKATVENLKQFAERVEEHPIKSSVDDLPDILPAIFNYAFHKDSSFRLSALPAFIKLTNLLDLNKHLKEQPWWSQMKEQMIQKVDILMELIISGDENWSNLWCTTLTLLGSDLKAELVLLNKLLKVVEKAFKVNKEDVKDQGFKCWRKLISNFAINKQELNNKRRLTLLVIPLKAGNHATHRLCVSKMETWKYLLYNLDQESEMTVQLVIVHFLEFMFGGVGSLAPACKVLNTECGKAFLQLIKTLFVFRSLPDIFIKYAILCIEHITDNVDLAIDIWKCLLNNMKLLQWPDNLVTTLMTEIVTSGEKNAVFRKSETYAQLVRNLYTGCHSLPVGVLVKNIDRIITVAFEPDVLLNFTESWCNDLLEIVGNTDPISLPQDVMGIIIPKLVALSTGDVFRDEKVKLLRGIWMTVINIYSKWTFSEGLREKNGSTQSDLHNIHQLLLYGATDLSSTWNKFQIKSWKSLYSEGVKNFSLLPEADKFVSGLVQLLVDGIRNGKLPFHVAVDVVSILLEFHLSKDVSSIRPFMMELAEKGMNLLQIDPSSSILLGTYIKIIVSAARSEPALVNDVSAVIDKMSSAKETLSGGSHDKIRNMVFKAQHQLHGLKSTRIQEKSDSPNTSTTTPSSSPTMTSFLRRLAKSKESKAKLSSTSPSQSSEKSPSPAVTPTSKKTNSPFADLKSEDFVFVPPKNRKTILTDHQKESLSSRKHDIPALYQDLSQDNSQSAFESIVTSVQVVEEDVNKLHVHTPKKHNGSIELGLKVLTPKEAKHSTSGIEVREPEESKLLNNKENDCFNNNTNSPFSSVGKQDKLVSKDVSSFKTVLPNDDSKKCEDNSHAGVADASKPLQEKKIGESKLNDTKKSSIIKTCENTFKAVSKKEKEENLKTSVEKSECRETSKINSCSKTNKTDNESLATETTSNNVIDQNTPKRNFKRNKIIVSVKKSGKKDVKNPKTSEEENSLTPDNKERKSPRNSSNTPKVSPRRLRKRKSGVTPILSAGEFSKKKKSFQSPLCNKTTPVEKVAESTEIKSALNEEHKDVNNCNENKCIGSTNGIPSEKLSMVTSEKSSTETKLVVDEECDKTEKISEKLIMKKENINVDVKCSPVKVILSRISLNDSSSCSNTNNRICGPGSEKQNNTHGGPIKNPIKLFDHENQVDSNIEGIKNTDTGLEHPKKKPQSVIRNKSETEGSIKETNTELKEVLREDEEISVKCTVSTESKNTPSEPKSYEGICTNSDKLSESKQITEVEQTHPVKNRYSPLIITRSIEPNNKSTDTSQTSAKNQSSVDTSVKVPLECGAAVTTVESKAENTNGFNKFSDLENTNRDGKSLLDKESTTTPQINPVELKTNSTVVSNDDMENLLLHNKESESLCAAESSPSQNTRSSVKKQSVDHCDSEIEVIYDAKDNMNKIQMEIIAESETVIKEVITVKEDTNKLPPSPQEKTNLSKSLNFVDELQQTIDIKRDENSSSLSVGCKPISSSNTPIKSGQKGLKQTQLPFTPVRKSLEASMDKPTNLNEKSDSICDKTNFKDVTSHTTSASETKKANNLDSITCSVETEKDREIFKENKEETQLGCEVEGTRINQEVPRTPEKNKPVQESGCLENFKITTDDFSVGCKDSEDVIASSQQDEFNTHSFSVLNGPITSSSPIKLPSKSPKKHENASFGQIYSSSERVLRCSPLKVENSRFSGTPIKKSVCRRLDVEIGDNSSEIEGTDEASGGVDQIRISSSHCEDKTINQPQVTLSRADYSEEFLNDIKLLNGDRKKPDEIYDCGSDKNNELDKLKLLEKNQLNGISTITSPSSHKTLKRFLLEPTSSTVESSKTTLGSLRLENSVTGSPKSPSSRTNQMMELAMQDKEKTISSPVSSLKKRKVNPLRLGPVLKTPLNQSVTLRTLNGPSEDWVRRTYSPTASPNSSILKRRGDPQPLSPDCSPPSNKKKRVSFLDPPVSESLLFCKRTPGKGQIQRPEPKQESESEDVPSQGSVQLICPVEDTNNQLQASVYSPLKQCSDPLSAVLERIVSVQWASELESQLLRLGVTTVGQLSALTGATVERLPFIPPKLERLRKILQNYDNEINEKEESSKTECMSLDEEEECVTPPIEEISNAIASSEEGAASEFEASTELPKMAETTSSMAEQIKSSIESNPDLINELGQRLDVDIIMSILKCAVTKLKTQDDTR